MPVQPNQSMTKDTHPFTVVCDRPTCMFRTGHQTHPQAEAALDAHRLSNTCPMEGKKSYLLEETDERGQRYTAVHMSKSTLEKLWDNLDAAYTSLKEDADFEQNKSEIKGRCAGLAQAILYMSTPYFTEIKEVTIEAMKRYKIKTGEIEFAPTPGYQYNPPPAGTKTYSEAVKRASGEILKEVKDKPKTEVKFVAPKSKLSDLTEETIAALKFAVQSGMFDDKKLADMYGISVADVGSLKSS